MASGVRLALKKPPAPVEKPAIVPVARSGRGGSAGLPAVARRETVRFGIVPVQPLQKRSRSARVSVPVCAAVKVCPAQLVLLNPKPLLVTVRFCWSMKSGLASLTSPGLALRLTLFGMPARKSPCVVSVRNALVGAAASAKSCVVVLPSVTTMLEAEAEVYPGKLAVMVGYVPAGRLR